MVSSFELSVRQTDRRTRRLQQVALSSIAETVKNAVLYIISNLIHQYYGSRLYNDVDNE